MSSFMAFGSRQIRLAERSHSNLALVVSCLCEGEDHPPPSDDTDEGCQWEIQNDASWVPYWESLV
jgi:hypothetical protein